MMLRYEVTRAIFDYIVEALAGAVTTAVIGIAMTVTEETELSFIYVERLEESIRADYQN